MKQPFVAGALPVDGGVLFRVWAPDHDRVEVVFDDGAAHALERAESGYFHTELQQARAGTRYRYRLDGDRALPDPASRFQPDGPHASSEVIDATTFEWSDAAWPGVEDRKHVVYELHVGTFTRAGTWRSAAEQLPYLANLGVSVIELMPVSEFDGAFNWGYDGVAPYAPAHVYGRPDDMRHFVDAAHAEGIGVILDVVYNHMGPSGCYMLDYAASYFSTRYRTDWGEALNFDDEQSAPVREFVLGNAEYWVRDFHIDGFRVDATQNIYDSGTPHILTELTARVRAAAAPRRAWLVAENEPQDRRIFDDFAFDAAWNDDFHHSAMVALTGRREAYYTDYTGSAQELVSAAKWGYLFQGQFYEWQKKRRGSGPLRTADARRFIHYLQNHDQIANSATGARVHALTSAAELRALTALLHLLPQHVMLFQGQEFSASAPFLFFADHDPELARKVHQGRRDSLKQFPSAALPEVQQAIPDPAAASTFRDSQLDHAEHDRHAHVLRLHRDLIAIAREDRVFADADGSSLHGAILGPAALVLRWLNDGNDRVLVVNLGDDLEVSPQSEPLLALPQGEQWQTVLATEDPMYGGAGAPAPAIDAPMLLPARCAFVLRPEPVKRKTDGSA
jgi:maltooligosyltrehalose trehalohydrolase